MRELPNTNANASVTEESVSQRLATFTSKIARYAKHIAAWRMQAISSSSFPTTPPASSRVMVRLRLSLQSNTKVKLLRQENKRCDSESVPDCQQEIFSAECLAYIGEQYFFF